MTMHITKPLNMHAMKPFSHLYQCLCSSSSEKLFVTTDFIHCHCACLAVMHFPTAFTAGSSLNIHVCSTKQKLTNFLHLFLSSSIQVSESRFHCKMHVAYWLNTSFTPHLVTKDYIQMFSLTYRMAWRLSTPFSRSIMAYGQNND